MESHTTSKIVDTIVKNKYYSIIPTGTRDVSRVEHVSIIRRLFNINIANTEEHYIGLLRVENSLLEVSIIILLF